MTSLDGAWAKLDRGDEHAAALESEIQEASDWAYRVGFAQEFDPSTSTIRLTISAVPTYPIRWGLVAGDAVQDFRAALNYLAWELAKWNTARQDLAREPSRRTEFPIATKPGNFRRDYLEDLYADHVSAIEGLQPYGPASIERARERQQAMTPNYHPDSTERLARAGAAFDHPLTKLQKLSNIDKHQSLWLIAARHQSGSINEQAFEPDDCEIVTTGIFLISLLEVGMEWGKLAVKPTGRDPRVRSQHPFTAEIAFSNFWSLQDTLAAISTEVRTILKMFEPVFDH